ncbi:hypothetical protein QZH41_020502 [Actinostola sp. cb2023]|nr:hypothetical protein QZH41_020502 [Actinostola sp. cb2023]
MISSIKQEYTDNCNEENWWQNKQNCYKFYLDTKAGWNDASVTCAQQGGTLGIFRSMAKLHFVKDFMQRQSSSSAQILVGLRQDVSGGWKWSDGTSVQSNLWNVTQPSGPKGTVNVQLVSLDNVPDSEQLPFVCQKDLP